MSFGIRFGSCESEDYKEKKNLDEPPMKKPLRYTQPYEFISEFIK